jgi:hypothetical protein
MLTLENAETLKARCFQLSAKKPQAILRIPTVLGSGHQQSCGAVRPEFRLPNKVSRIVNHFELLVRGSAEDLSCFDVRILF